MPLWFVYRSHYEGPLSRRVRRLRSDTLLSWFQAKAAEALAAPSEDAAESIANGDLGGRIYGFGTYFAAVHKHRLRPPATISALRRQLREHLYVEGPKTDNIHLDDHSLRVRTDDDEVELAYYFFDDQVLSTHPERLSWLLHQEPALPEIGRFAEDSSGKKFAPPVAVPPLLCAKDKAKPKDKASERGTTYLCLQVIQDGDSLTGEVCSIPSVRLPSVMDFLREGTPFSKPQPYGAEFLDTWPLPVRLMRAMLLGDGSKEPQTLQELLTLAARYPVFSLNQHGNSTRLGVHSVEEAAREFAEARPKDHGGEPERSLVHTSEHAALVCTHQSTFFGYQQWILFDDVFADAHPDLASSILLCTLRWDPFVRASRPATPKDPQAAAARIAEAKQRSQARAFAEALSGRQDKGRPYDPALTYVASEILEHSKFGVGVVKQVIGKYMDVCFKDGERRLIHAPPVPHTSQQAFLSHQGKKRS